MGLTVPWILPLVSPICKENVYFFDLHWNNFENCQVCWKITFKITLFCKIIPEGIEEVQDLLPNSESIFIKRFLIPRKLRLTKNLRREIGSVPLKPAHLTQEKGHFYSILWPDPIVVQVECESISAKQFICLAWVRKITLQMLQKIHMLFVVVLLLFLEFIFPAATDLSTQFGSVWLP